METTNYGQNQSPKIFRPRKKIPPKHEFFRQQKRNPHPQKKYPTSSLTKPDSSFKKQANSSPKNVKI